MVAHKRTARCSNFALRPNGRAMVSSFFLFVCARNLTDGVALQWDWCVCRPNGKVYVRVLMVTNGELLLKLLTHANQRNVRINGN